jgi:hypothetical protein
VSASVACTSARVPAVSAPLYETLSSGARLMALQTLFYGPTKPCSRAEPDLSIVRILRACSSQHSNVLHFGVTNKKRKRIHVTSDRHSPGAVVR